ncbi:MAG: 16S rRNA (guanine(527)-N(7))-methyltransferase RsmG [Alistipes sp.]|nr:16S rRNA (guanine(527)-N(7))-methyltransferase RsmG [Alistipes sp.]
MIAIIEKYFPSLSEHQKEQLRALYALYADWNAKINVVSRKDFEQLYLRHVLHSLAIAKVCQFEAGARVLDVGCGGGFPSVPLAIMFPEVQFISADSIGKKITVVKGVCEGAGITNIDARHTRVEQIPERFDYVVSRAVTEMPQFVKWIWSKIDRGQRGTLPNGILYLKGGDLQEELAATRMKWREYQIADFFEEEFFETKKVVYTSK